MLKAPTEKNELRAALRACKQQFAFAAATSAAVNTLMLTPIIYMLTVYDKVVASGSMSTLTMLTILMTVLILSLGGFELVRSAALVSASNKLDSSLRKRVYDSTFRLSLLSGGMSHLSQPISDLTSLRQFLTGQGIIAILDAPWFPIYIGVMFMFHPLFGVLGIISAIVMLALALLNETGTNELLKEANAANNRLLSQTQSSLRNTEIIHALGMQDALSKRQDALQFEVLQGQTLASRRSAQISSLSKAFRLIVQSLALGLGAYLTLNQSITPGMMIAGSLLLGRALAPIDTLVSSWKPFTLARTQYNRLEELLTQIPPAKQSMVLPAPTGKVEVKQAYVAPPGSTKPIINAINFSLNPGAFLGVLGPSASGKSTLSRALLGVWHTTRGSIRLDGADISQWDREALGSFVGYLPQDIELFDGSVADNISRFRDVEAELIIEAAQMAGIHEMILQLPQGYDTIIGSRGGALSGGQRQQVGLARAVFGNPSFIVLDEPNSNLDEQGEQALIQSLQRVKERGCTAVLVTHKASLLQCVDSLLVLNQGNQLAFGPKDQVLSKLAAAKPKPTKNGGAE